MESRHSNLPEDQTASKKSLDADDQGSKNTVEDKIPLIPGVRCMHFLGVLWLERNQYQLPIPKDLQYS